MDVLAFDAALARRDHDPLRGYPALEEAISLYRGPLLQEWAEEWAFQEQRSREQAYLAAREELAAHARARGDLAGAERHLRFALGVDPLRENTQRALMEILAAEGNFAAALLDYRELRHRVHRELNAEPDPETRALFQRLRAEAREKAAAHRPPRAGRWTPPRRGPATADNNGVSPPPPQPSTPPSQPAALGSCDWPRPTEEDGLQRRDELAESRNTGAAVPRHLPLQLTRFIGRQTEMAKIRRYLSAHRLVTLTGAGGCGKTRLALEAAAQIPGPFRDGIWFAALAPLADPSLVTQTVAASLDIREQPDRPVIQTLVEALQPKELLLVLDNCEHLVSACAELAETLLQSCPHLRLLATSREPLGIGGERTYRVPSLSVPGVQAFRRSGVQDRQGTSTSTSTTRTPERLLQYEAVRLFVERAAMAQPGFTLSAENANAVAQICCRLDGIPLALELAAARLQALPVETLNERLDDMFGLLTGGRRTALARHRTLRALIDWGYDLLSQPEKALLRRLSVFAGGWTLEAAEAVCADFDPQIHADERRLPSITGACPAAHSPYLRSSASICGSKILNEEVLDLLTSLVEKSLVLYEERGREGRYRLLEMIREYARERLAESEEAAAFRERHARYFLALAEIAEREFGQGGQRFWLDRLEREHDNLRTALAWSIETVGSGQWLVDRETGSGSKPEPSSSALTTNHHPLTTAVELGLRLASALEEFWCRRSHLMEGRDHLLRLLALPAAAAPTAARARALSVAGRLTGLRMMGLHTDSSGIEPARRLHEESLAIWRALGDRAGIASGLLHLGEAALGESDLKTARPFIEESLAIRRELGDPRGIVDALLHLAEVRVLEHDGPAACVLAEEGLTLARAMGDRVRIHSALGQLGQLSLQQGDMGRARALNEESLTVARELDDRIGMARAINRLGSVATVQEDYVAARALFEQSLPLWRELRVKQGLMDTLFHLSQLRQQEEDYAGGYVLLEDIDSILREGDPGATGPFALLGLAAADLGRWDEAAAHCARRLRLCHPDDMRVRHFVAWAVTGMARVALARGRPVRAARLFGAVSALVEGGCDPWWPHRQADFDRFVAATRAQLEEAEFAAAWAEGQTRPLDQSMAEALEEAPAG